MRVCPLPLLRFFIVFCALWIPLVASDAPPPVRWPLDQPAKIGGHSAAVLGSPEARADAGGPYLHFNGRTDGLLLTNNPISGWAEFTIEALINPSADGPAEQRFLHIQDEHGSRVLMETRVTATGWALDTFLYSVPQNSRRPLLDPTKLHPADRWTWVALVYAHGHMTHYIDGAKELEGDVNFSPMTTGSISLGVRQNKVYWFEGGMREVRFHPVAVAPEKLQRAH